MFYPGQIIYFTDEKSLAIYLGQATEEKFTTPASYTILSYNKKEDGTFQFEDSIAYRKDMKYIFQPDKSTHSGKSIWYGPKDDKGHYQFRRKQWNSEITNDELAAELSVWENAILDLLETNWFMEGDYKNVYQ